MTKGSQVKIVRAPPPARQSALRSALVVFPIRGMVDTLDKRFLKAAQAGDLDEAKRLLVESPAVVHARSTSKGYTALHFAAMGGAIPVVEWLLEQGFDVMTEAPGGVTPLAVALEYKRFTTVRRLQQLRDGEVRQHVGLVVLRSTSHGSRPLLATPHLATARHSSPQLATARHSSPPRPPRVASVASGLLSAPWRSQLSQAAR